MVGASRLHDPCLVALFKQLPPADQMTARKVCRRWADLVTYAARSTHSLGIFIGDLDMDKFVEVVNIFSLGTIKVVSLLQKEDGSPMFPLARFSQWNALQYREGLDEATVQAIVATFVNIKTLQIALIRVTSTQVNSISHLLELWPHQLTTLKLSEGLFHEPDDHSADRLFAAINGLTTLKSLDLYFFNLSFRDLPIISRLEQLRLFCDECSPSQFAAMLRQYATPSTSLRTVEYLCRDPESVIEQFTSLGDHLLSRFIRFDSPWFPHTNSELISSHFRHLTNLHIRPATTLRRLFGHLSQLIQLLYLCLNIDFPFLLPDDQPHLLLPQLKSVKALGLDLTIRSHRQVEQLKISWTMPNVEAIEFDFNLHSECNDCTIVNFSDRHFRANPTTFKHCFRQMFVPLKRTCTKLRAILHKHEEVLDSADELLAE